MHPLFTFPAAYVIEKHGTRVAVVVGCLLSIAGAAVRLLVNEGFWLVLLGQTIAGIGRPFIVNNQTKISSNWYHASKRAGVTSFYALMINVSLIAGLLFPGIYFAGYEFDADQPQKGKDLTFNLMLVEFVVVVAFLVPSLLLMRDKPPTPPAEPLPPSQSSFGSLVKQLGKEKNYMLLLLGYFLYFGSFNAIAMNLSFLLEPWFGADAMVSSLVGATPILSGFVGVLVMTRLQRRENKSKKYILVCMGGSLACILLFYPVLSLQSLPLACLLSMSNSFFLIPLIPMMLELSCELAYPVGEGAAASFMIAAGNLGGFALGFLMSTIVRGESVGQSLGGLAVVVSAFLVGILACALMAEERKRQMAEKQLYEQQKSGMQSLRSQTASNDQYIPPRLSLQPPL